MESQIQTAKITYLNEAKQGIAKGWKLIDELVSTAKRGSRLAHEIVNYKELFNHCGVGNPILLSQYNQDIFVENAGDSFLIASTEEVCELLKDDIPRLPILIPRELNPDSNNRLDLETYLKVLRTRPSLDMHDLDVDYSKYSGAPQRVASVKALARLNPECKKGPVNFLNLLGHKRHAVPGCLGPHEDYHILQSISDTNGKDGLQESHDLTHKSQFQLLASRGAVHTPHVDLHGLVTSIFNDQGEKLWPLWSGLSEGEVSDFILHGHYRRGAAIYLRPGDLLIQPPLTVHAPLSLSVVLMTGTMHLHPRGLLNSIRQMKLESRHPEVTNEDPSDELRQKLPLILSLWEARAGPWHWGSEEDLQKCMKLLGRRRKRRSTRKARAKL